MWWVSGQLEKSAAHEYPAGRVSTGKAILSRGVSVSGCPRTRSGEWPTWVSFWFARRWEEAFQRHGTGRSVCNSPSSSAGKQAGSVLVQFAKSRDDGARQRLRGNGNLPWALTMPTADVRPRRPLIALAAAATEAVAVEVAASATP